jgi:excinuclease ABC subunit C
MMPRCFSSKAAASLALNECQPSAFAPSASSTISALEERVGKTNDLALLSDHLSLLRRWYYRPEKQRIGEIFFANEDGTWPIRKILRGAARSVIGDPKPMAETNRDAAKEAAKNIKTKVLHEGRPEVERTVAVLPKDR